MYYNAEFGRSALNGRVELQNLGERWGPRLFGMGRGWPLEICVTVPSLFILGQTERA